MIIACPACATRYVVPDSAIGAEGRTVRCAKCRHSWFQDGPEIALPPASDAAAAVTPPPPAPAERAAQTPVAEPEVNVVEQEPITFQVTVQVYPEVTLGDYTSVRVEPRSPGGVPPLCWSGASLRSG